MLLSLLFLVTFFVTSSVSGQTCFNSETSPGSIVCAGETLTWKTTSFAVTAGQAITWKITEGSSGAFFVANGLQTYSTTAVGNINTVLVNVGAKAGTVTVVMTFDATPSVGSCSSSGISKLLQVEAIASTLKCHDDKGTITAVNFGTIIVDGNAPIDLGNYTFTLNPGGISNNTGVFEGVAPGVYTIDITDGSGCKDSSQAVTLINPEVKPVFVTCPGNVDKSACLYADQNAVNVEFAAWLANIQKSGGTGNLTVVTDPINPQAPPVCGGEVVVKWTVTDECLQRAECSAVFKVGAAPAVTFEKPADKLIKFCELTNEQNLADAFKVFLEGFKVAGGCAPTLTRLDNGVPNFCGGDGLVVRFVIKDRCYVDQEISARFEVERPRAGVLGGGGNLIVDACANQLDLDAKIQAFIDIVKANNDCGILPVTVDPFVRPDKCGGEVEVTFRALQRCLPELVFKKKIIVNAAAVPIIKAPANRDLGCNPVLPPAVEVAQVTSNCPTTVTHLDGAPVIDGCNYRLVRTFKVVTDCYPNGVTAEQVFTWKVDLPFTIKCPEGKDLGCLNKCGDIDIPAPGVVEVGTTCPYKVVSALGAVTNLEGCKKQRIRTYTVTTECNPLGFKCEQVFTWTEEPYAPIILKGPIGRDLGCNPIGDLPVAGEVLVKAPCGYTVEVKVGDVKDLFKCKRTQIRTYVAVSPCGKRSLPWLEIFTWTEDKTAPVLTCLPDKTICAPFAKSKDLHAVCDKLCDLYVAPEFDTPKVFDACDSKCLIAVGIDLTITKNADGTVTYCKKWQAADDCGNIGYATQCITLKCCDDVVKPCEHKCQHYGCKDKCKHHKGGKHHCGKHND